MESVIIIGCPIPSSYLSASKNGAFNFPNFTPYHFKSLIPKSTTIKFHTLICAAASNGGNNGNSSDEEKQRNSEEGTKGVTNGGGGGEENEKGLPRLNMKWVDLLVNPDPDNLVAVGLTGVLAWASAQVLWQLFVISIAIVLAALKYSFIAALLIFILITLL